MKYNELIPDITYDNNSIKNIFYRYYLTEDVPEEFLSMYSVSENQNIQEISYELYNDIKFWWVIAILNDIRDFVFDLPLSHEIIQDMARDNSMVDGELDLQLYVKNYNLLIEENDNKKSIKIIKPNYLGQFITSVIRNISNV